MMYYPTKEQCETKKSVVAEISRIEGEELSVEWRIQDFLSWPHENSNRQSSTKFLFCNANWYLTLWPNNPVETKDPASEWLRLDIERYTVDRRKTTFHVTLGIKGMERDMDVEKEFSGEDVYYHAFKGVCSRSELNQQKSTLMPEDVLTVSCTIKHLGPPDLTVNDGLKKEIGALKEHIKDYEEQIFKIKEEINEYDRDIKHLKSLSDQFEQKNSGKECKLEKGHFSQSSTVPRGTVANRIAEFTNLFSGEVSRMQKQELEKEVESLKSHWDMRRLQNDLPQGEKSVDLQKSSRGSVHGEMRKDLDREKATSHKDDNGNANDEAPKN